MSNIPYFCVNFINFFKVLLSFISNLFCWSVKFEIRWQHWYLKHFFIFINCNFKLFLSFQSLFFNFSLLVQIMILISLMYAWIFKLLQKKCISHILLDLDSLQVCLIFSQCLYLNFSKEIEAYSMDREYNLMAH